MTIVIRTRHKEDGLRKSIKSLFKVEDILAYLNIFYSNKTSWERLEKSRGFYWHSNWRLNTFSCPKIFHEDNKELLRRRSGNSELNRGPVYDFPWSRNL